jgi:hypothetical protein
MFIGGVIIALIAVLVILAVMKFIPATRPYIISVLVLIVGIWTGWLWAFLAAVRGADCICKVGMGAE